MHELSVVMEPLSYTGNNQPPRDVLPITIQTTLSYAFPVRSSCCQCMSCQLLWNPCDTQETTNQQETYYQSQYKQHCLMHSPSEVVVVSCYGSLVIHRKQPTTKRHITNHN